MITLSKIVLTFAVTYYVTWLLNIESRRATMRPAQSLFIYLIIGAASLFYPGFIFLMPFFWISQVILNVFNVKIFIASILGALMPWLWVFSFRFLYQREILNSGEPYDFFLYDGFSYRLPQIVLTVLFAIFIYCVIYYTQHKFFFRAKVREFFQAVILLCGASFFLSIVFPTHLIYWIPVIASFIYAMIHICFKRHM